MTTTTENGDKAAAEIVQRESAYAAESEAAFGAEFEAAFKKVMGGSPAQKPEPESDVEPGAEPDAEEPDTDGANEADGAREDTAEDEEELEPLPTEDPDWWSLDDDEVVEAVRVCKREQLTTDEIKRLFGTKEQLLARAAKFAAKQADVDRLLNERGAKKEATAANEGDATQRALPPVDFAELARPIADDLGIQDDEGRKRYGKVFETMFERALAPLINAVVGLYRNQESDWIESERGKRPVLAAQDVFDGVLEEARERVKSPRLYPNVHGRARWAQAIEDAMRLRIRDLPSPSEETRTKRVEKLTKKGRIQSPTKRTEAPQLSETERYKRMLAAAADASISPDEFQRRFHRVVDVK